MFTIAMDTFAVTCTVACYKDIRAIENIQIPMIENDDKPNKLTTLIFNIIAIVGVAVVFRLLPRFSQKVHLLYP